MKAPHHKLALSAVASAMFSLFTSAAQGATKVDIEKPKFDPIPSPQFAGVKGESWSPEDWLKMECKLRIEQIPEPKSKTCETLTVKWYVAIENPEKASTYLKLTKEIQHVNLPLGKDVHTCVFLSPASIRRITGSDRAGKNCVKFVGIEVSADGAVVADAAVGKDKWWTMASDKISESSTVPLLSKSETPFAACWWDRYAEEKPATGTR
jgi:hypothetical protein